MRTKINRYMRLLVKSLTKRNRVGFAQFENMRKLETEGAVGELLRPGDAANPESYKVRKGEIGGYVNYLTQEDIQWMDAEIAATLSDFYAVYKR